MNPVEVTGTIVFRPPPPPLAGATASIWLEDVTLADAPARVVARQTLATIPDDAAAGGLGFRLPCPAPDLRTRYTVRVHVDLDGDGRVSPGDYLSTASHPVLTFGHPDRITVEVRPIS